MTVLEDDEGSRLIWEASIEPIELETFVKESMKESIIQLEKVLAGN